MPNEDVVTVIRWEEDAASAENAVRHAQDVVTAFERLESEVSGVRKELRSALKDWSATSKAEIDVAKASRKASDELDRQRKAAEKAADETRRRAEEEARLFGDIESRTRAITGALSYLGGTSGQKIAETINIGSEVLASVEAVGLLKQELPDLSKNLLIGTDAANSLTTRLIQQMVPGMSAAAAQTTALVASVGALSAATVGVVLAYRQAKQIIDDSAEATRGFIEVNQRYAEIIATSTTEEVEEAIKQNEERNRALQIEREGLAELVRLADEVGGWEGAVLDMADAIGVNLGGIEDAQDRLKEVDAEIGNNIDLNTRLEQALRDTATAAADAEEELRRSAEKRREENQADIELYERLARERVRDRQRAEEWTTEQAEQRLAQIELEKEAIAFQQSRLEANNKLLPSVRRAEEERLQLILDGYQREADALIEMVQPAAEAREYEAAAIEGFFNLVGNAADAFGDQASGVADLLLGAQEDLARAEDLAADYRRKSQEIEEDRQRAVLQEAEDWARDQAKALRDHYQDLGDLEHDFLQDREDLLEELGEIDDEAYQERLDDLREYHKEDKRRFEDHQEELFDIASEMERDIQRAIADLDAAQAFSIAQGGEDRLAEEEQQYQKEAQRRHEDFEDRMELLERERQEQKDAARDRLRDLRQQYDQERQDRINAFRQERADEREQRQVELNRQREEWRIEDERRRRRFQDRLHDLGVYQSREAQMTFSHHSNLLQTTGQFMSNLQSQWSQGLNNIAQNAQNALSPQAQTALGAISTGFTTLASSFGGYFQHGGDPRPGTWGMVGEQGPEPMYFAGPSRIFPNRDLSKLGTSITVHAPISIAVPSGSDPEQLVLLTEQRIIPKLTRAVQQAAKGQGYASA